MYVEEWLVFLPEHKRCSWQIPNQRFYGKSDAGKNFASHNHLTFSCQDVYEYNFNNVLVIEVDHRHLHVLVCYHYP